MIEPLLGINHYELEGYIRFIVFAFIRRIILSLGRGKPQDRILILEPRVTRLAIELLGQMVTFRADIILKRTPM